MRFFNTAGPCDPQSHYMLPPERRLPETKGLIDRQLYFVLHAPRQSGKTTLVRTLAQRLTAEGRYTALLTSCEAGQAAGGDVEKGISAVLDAIRLSALNDLPEELRPPMADALVPATTRLQDLLSRWSRRSPRPIVLFLDEIDALLDAVLISVLRQLRAAYASRPKGFPQSVALIGLRDVRDYRARRHPEAEDPGSFFNITVESFTLSNFTVDDVAKLYEQHTAETGQAFTAEAKSLAYRLTQGQPWLVNALARQAVEKLVPDPALPVEVSHVEQAKAILVERRGTHLDALIDFLGEPRVKRVIEPILAGKLLSPAVLDDDIQFVKDLGLVTSGPSGLEIANPIYREIIPQALTNILHATI
jgi:type II secretory pathway predicted ATPase ExeA